MSESCDKDVYENGVQVFMTHTIRAHHVELWVKTIALDSGQKVDWHYGAGRAFILTTGDVDLVKASIKKFRYMHDQLYIEQSIQYIDRAWAEENVKGIWQYNGLE